MLGAHVALQLAERGEGLAAVAGDVGGGRAQAGASARPGPGPRGHPGQRVRERGELGEGGALNRGPHIRLVDMRLGCTVVLTLLFQKLSV